MFKITPYLEGVIVGLLLYDAWIVRGAGSGTNHRIWFKQSLTKNFEFFWTVFRILSPIILSIPKGVTSIRYGKASYGVTLTSSPPLWAGESLPSITKITTQFLDSNKIIPSDIYNLLTPEALAFLILGDGEAQASSLRLCTDSYTLSEVITLMNVLIIRYDLSCNIHWKIISSTNKRARIYIPSR